MHKSWFFMLFLTNSCGMHSFFSDNEVQKSREIASLSVQELLLEDTQSFASDIDEKLLSLHSYYVIGQKNILTFDQELKEKSFLNLYESMPYLKLIAVRTQVEEIEDELKDVLDSVKKNPGPNKEFLLRMKIIEFSKKSDMASLSMQNLISKLGFISKRRYSDRVAMKEVSQELVGLETHQEFKVYEKNIEHLAHLLDINVSGKEKRFFPSSTKAGSISGNEFPTKVWSLTFDDGPIEKISPAILENLKKAGLKATYFQLTKSVENFPKVALDIRDAGMEMASHSYSHLQLTKVGALTLEREITEAVDKLEKILQLDIKFFRLPYGAGVGNANIREKIAANNLIHVFWNVDTLDWMPGSSDKIIERTKLQIINTKKDAGIILFHDVHERTIEASKSIMEYLKEDGRRTCTLGEIVTQMNEGAKTVCAKK